ncbi:hypothetical protein [Ulvibacterium marinum]|uniref:Uncharacterized protein n=1 Tax=Ulvibacterium marinum TaxID=2419782 RepID=A0A3B0C348_9FLAO|nr:hypothetical protein [Ulvibacterium marinum]RKN78739.1 hypothetical protein D7Z94_21330 [Ulvibacterium marinum]
MKFKRKTIAKGFIIAGLMNMSVLVFSRFFTNKVINETDPDVMSNFGLVMIVVWGLAYISVAKTYQNVTWLIGIFAFEKLIYGITWAKWIFTNNLATVFEKDAMAGMFYAVYGVNDWLFCVFFSIVFFPLMKANNSG